MKLVEFKEFNRDNISRAINKRKVAITAIMSVILILILIFVLLYIYNNSFRKWADMHVLMKVVKEGSLSSIDIDKSEKISIYAYDKYVALVNVNKLDIYNSSAKQVASLSVNLNNPIFCSNGKYLAIGDKGKQKVYLISGTKTIWETDIEGTVSKVSVNENGYVSVVCMGSTYKSVVAVYNPSGSLLFKTFIPNNTVIDSSISSDNKLLSFAEINTSKTTIESIVKTISVKDATGTTNNSIINTYNIPSNTLVVDLKYHGSKNLICKCDDGIYLLSDGNINQIANFEEPNKKYRFAGINLLNTIYEVEEISDGISAQTSNVLLINSANKKVKTYTVDGIAKETAASDDNIAVNLGTEVYFINLKGWLIKKYVATQEVKDVIISERVAAIVFRDKIEILIL